MQKRRGFERETFFDSWKSSSFDEPGTLNGKVESFLVYMVSAMPE